ncbi:hypothetical protein [Phyllobacterium sp. SB3]|uniref:hypothetical protein n=1 Tax=Phyllobacterium sp. SB3 TaxID=3156073 RepID=UPI0032AF85CB
MTLLNLSDEERSSKHLRAVLSVDDQGREILYGLSRAQSEWMIDYQRLYPVPLRKQHPSTEERQIYVRLYEKHNLARLYR